MERKIKVEFNYGSHIGGTKFYSTIVIEDLTTAKLSKSVLIKVYGPNGKRGVVTHEVYSDYGQAQAAAQEMLKKKARREYIFEDGGRVELFQFQDYDLHELISEITTRASEAPSGSITKRLLSEYVGDIVEGVKKIDNSSDYDDDISFSKPKVKSKPKSEPVRNANWGSW